MRINAEIKNTGTASSGLTKLGHDNAAVVWNGATVPLDLDVPAYDLSGGSTTRGAFQAIVPEEFQLAGAEFVLGTPTQHQAVLTLTRGAIANFDKPLPFTVNESTSLRGIMRIKVTGGEIVPARCEGLPDSLWYSPTDKGELVLVLNVMRTAIGNGGDYSSMLRSKGKTIDALVPAGDDRILSGQHDRVRFCYSLTSSAGGRYTVVWKPYCCGASTEVPVDVPRYPQGAAG